MKTSFISSFWYSLSFIFISDLTDKSIFLIIFLSKKLPLLTLYIVSLSAVLLMNYLSILLGYYLPKLIPQIYMEIIAFILFTSFGILSLIESRKEKEIIIGFKELNNSENDYSLMNEEELETDIESNKELLFPTRMRSNSISTIDFNINNDSNYGLITAIFFALCLSDLGDKSQLAIVTMAAIYNIYGILLGSTIALLGTVSLAVLFGNWLTEKISPKKLLFIGGLIFLVFGVETLVSIYNNY